MKVVLNKDVLPLGEEGDVKDVARGYARNYLFPRDLALPYNAGTVKLFESRREAIEMRKSQKRQDAAGLREKLEATAVLLTLPAGPNGKLYGSVTNQTIADELQKLGFQIERKRVEIPGNHIKSTGKYKVTVRLYESASAEITVNVEGQVIKEEPKAPAADKRRERRYGRSQTASAGDASTGTPAVTGTPDGTSAGMPDGTPAGDVAQNTAKETGEAL